MANLTLRGMLESYKDLNVYQSAIEGAVEIYQLTKRFPTEEKYSLTDQIRRSSRSVCANLAEAWRKRRYRAAFISKLNDAEGEACETQVWAELASRFEYLTASQSGILDSRYDRILGQLVAMIEKADHFLIH